MPKTVETLRKTDLSEIISQSSNHPIPQQVPTQSPYCERASCLEKASPRPSLVFGYVLYIFTQVSYKIRELTINELICVERTFHSCGARKLHLQSTDPDIEPSPTIEARRKGM